MTDLDLDRRLTRWLTAEAQSRAPERLVHATRSRVATTSQRRAWHSWAPRDTRRWGVALATAIGSLVLVLATSWIGSSDRTGVGGPRSPSPSPSSSRFPCPSERGVCLGPLSPGSYHSSRFAPGFTVTVPAGWTSTLDIRGQDDLSYDAGGSYRYPDGISFHDGISVFRQPIAESSAVDQPEAGVGHDARALAQWLAGHSDIVASQPAAVTIHGATGFRVTVGPRTGPRSSPDHCTTDHGLDQCESLFRGGDAPNGFGFGIVGPESAVIYFLDLPSGETVMVVIDDVDGVDAGGLMGAATPVVESLVFNQ